MYFKLQYQFHQDQHHRASRQNSDLIYKLHEHQHHKPYQDQHYKYQRDMYYDLQYQFHQDKHHRPLTKIRITNWQ